MFIQIIIIIQISLGFTLCYAVFEEFSFDIILHGIGRVKHPNSAKYPDQKVFLVKIEDYIYSVPYVEDNEEIFLKTIIPNSKATKKYFGGKK